MIVNNYVNALFEVSGSGSDLAFDNETIYEIISSVSLIISSCNEITDFFKSSKISREEKYQKIDRILELIEVNDNNLMIVKNFLRILIDNSRINILDIIVKGIRKKIDQENNIFKADIISSDKLSKKDLNIVINILEEKFGFGFKVNNIIDKSIISGALIKFNDVIYDLSLNGYLNSLSKRLIKES